MNNDPHASSLFDLSFSRRLHVVGIGGPGMSALARALHAMGHVVSGSDIRNSDVIDSLRDLGIKVVIGHRAELVHGCDAVSASSGVPSDNIEMAAARTTGIAALSRAEMLAAVCAQTGSIGVAGAHGKTTTTSLLALMLGGGQGECGFVVGGDAPGLHVNGAWVANRPFVVEADESDGTHEMLPLVSAIITNIDLDHLDHFGSYDGIIESFYRFARGVRGSLLVCANDRVLCDIATTLRNEGCNVLTYGTTNSPDLQATNVREDGEFQTFVVEVARGRFTPFPDGTSFEVTLRARGEHNVLNALGALGMALLYGASIEVACAVLGEFAGVSRRFDLRGQRHDITFVDDYAHLPAEISAVLRASRAAGNSWGRIVAVFQPNRFHRMAAMSGEYCDAFVDADVVVIGDIYASGTAPIAGVTGQLVVDAIRKSHPEAEVYYVPGRADLAARVADQLRSGDLCISTGCGDIETLPSETMTEIDMRDIEVALTRAKIKWQRSMPMGERTTYKVGGAARLGVFIAANAQFEALAAILARYEVPVVVLGRGSNTLVADTGFAGVCVLLGEFANTVIVESRNGSQVDVVLGGATPLPVAARQLSALGVTGFEWAVGVPGTVGGAVKMNAGGHGSDMARNLVQAHVINLRTGRSVWMPVEDLGLRFRGSSLPDGCVVSAVQLRLAECVPGEGDAEIAEVVRWRRENQPGGQNAGSVFVNPDDGAQSAGAIIDALGLRGFRIGSAAVSEKHANFIQADPEGTSADVLRVMTEVHRRVQEATGIHLHSEVRLVGFDRHLSFLIDTSVL